jgi:hypothetical protein
MLVDSENDAGSSFIQQAGGSTAIRRSRHYRGCADPGGTGTRRDPGADRALFDLRNRRPSLAGSLGPNIKLPVILDHEMVGRIVAFGPAKRVTPSANHCELVIALRGLTPSAARAFFAGGQEPTLCRNTRWYSCQAQRINRECLRHSQRNKTAQHATM